MAVLLLDWYSAHNRPLPWRTSPTPYHIWISEIMLQQTRIEAALPYYQRFITVLPDVAALAAAPEELLLKLWEGLGYYSRARNLQKAARVLMQQYGGALPADYEALLTLPGIGPYTAGAIASMAFSIPAAAVDGNVMRVLSRLTGDDTDVLSTAGKRRFTDLAWSLIPEQNPGRFNQAMMELGETVCLPTGVPHCAACPLRSLCRAHQEGLVSRLPVRNKKTQRRIEHRAVAVVIAAGDPPAVLLHQRAATGLLASLWELPNTLAKEPRQALPPALCALCDKGTALSAASHLFSHIEWRMQGYLFMLDRPVALPAGYVWATLADLSDAYPIPGAFSHYLKHLPSYLQ